jgi:hypothetical protein
MYEKVKVAMGLYGPRSGSFGYKYSELSPNITWESCRDRVQFLPQEIIAKIGLWMVHKKDIGNNIIQFIKKIETKLGIQKSKFGTTDNESYCFWIKPSLWWLKNLVRRSFLTMALRAGQRYKPSLDNFMECFEKSKYAKKTLPAVKLFLEGYTNYRGPNLYFSEGWQELFKNEDEKFVKSIMLKKFSRLCPIQTRAIW